MDVGVAAAAKTSARVLHQTIKERRHYQAWVLFGRLGEFPVIIWLVCTNTKPFCRSSQLVALCSLPSSTMEYIVSPLYLNWQ